MAEELPVTWRVVTEDYFKALRIPVLAGRAFDETDRAGGPLSIVINRSLADRVFAGQDPIGRELRLTRFGPPQTARVVGVVADTRQGRAAAPEPEVSVPYAQDSWGYFNLIVRGRRTTPEALHAAIGAAVRAVDPARPTFAQMRMEEAAERDLRQPRFGATLLALFAATAAVLASLGVVAVTAYSVAARTREIGIRVALGGRPLQVLAMVLRPAMGVVLAGAAVGVAAAAAGSRLIASQLHGVSPLDPQVLGLTGLLMAVVGAVASFVPARRAMRVAPTEALRGE
jgi:ABC-type antimicrobial peptide transport system permease subunit